MAIVGMYVAMLIAFFVIDAIALKFMMYPLFQRHIPDLLRDEVQLSVAAGFYAVYVIGVIYFAVMPALQAERPELAIMNGAFVGFLAYGTYEASNMATIKGWAWQMLITDVTWGTILTAGIALIGYAVGRALY